nr:DUF3619 family protein [uncultured Deefgea sp.]
MNEDQIGRMSQQVADAAVPDAVQVRLRQARQNAVAQSNSSKNSPSGILAMVCSHPKFALASLAVLLLMWVAVIQQQQNQRDVAIDIALLSSDVPMELLLESAMLDASE